MAGAALLARSRDYLEPALKGAGFAVSGGSDSMAMLLLLAPVIASAGGRVAVVTVDHGLRPEAAAEAHFVAALCAARGWPHSTLHWQHDGSGNLSAAARKGRYGLMADWARAQGLDCILLGHTQDDQAETVLMRLARGAGVDGLSAMAPARRAGGITWLRPLLDLGREELRGFLRAAGQAWCDDPSNESRDYERVRWRQAMADLARLGLTPAALAQSAGRLRRARDALADLAVAAEGVTSAHGAVIFERAAFADLAAETQERLIAAAARWISGADYPPRGAALAQARAVALGRGGFSLQGCLLHAGRERIVMARESRAVAALTAPLGTLWDGRWRVTLPAGAAGEIRALGEAGLAQAAIVPEVRIALQDSPLPRAAFAVTPALWQGDRLMAAPTLGFGGHGLAETVTDFVSFLKCD